MVATTYYNFFPYDRAKIIKMIGKQTLRQCLQQMLLIRNFEIRGESAYQHGFIGGFYHSYQGQEAIQTAAVCAMGKDKNWWVTTYRCHALALLLGATPKEIMAELYGKQTGNAKGRGGSMHLYTDRMLGGFGIVGGHVPVATGAGFSLKYQEVNDEASICFLGDGAVAQGAFHEALNLASLWKLPCIFVIENNQWGMGTAVDRAIAAKHLAEDHAAAYNMKSMTLDGYDFFNCYAGFKHAYEHVLTTKEPILIEAVAERFRGHSISDPGLYRSKESLKEIQEKHDPIRLFKEAISLSEEEFKVMDDKARKTVIEAMEYAEKSPWPDPVTLEEDVFSE